MVMRASPMAPLPVKIGAALLMLPLIGMPSRGRRGVIGI